MCTCFPCQTLPWGLEEVEDTDLRPASPGTQAQEHDCSFLLLHKAGTYFQAAALGSVGESILLLEI